MTNRTGFAGLSNALDDFSRLQFVVQQMLNGLATATPVQVKAVLGDTVDVQPMVHQVDGKDTGTPHSTIHGLPFFTLQAGASIVRLTPRVGDIGVAIFCHNDISSVKANKAPALPASRRRYSWSDGIYLGGLPALNGVATQSIILDDDEGISITAAPGKKVKITGDVELTGKLTASDDVIANGISLRDHKHDGVQTGSGQTGAPV
jgi:phage baseplate assembly protein gpV